jgi:transcriptional regulator with XRE-family HTH domain
MPVSVHHPRYQALQALLVVTRKAAGLSQVQLADRLGVGQSYVSKIERGETYVDVLLFIDWCQACGVLAGDVINELEQRTTQS